MAKRLLDSVVRSLPPPTMGNRIIYDSEVKGFGVRVTYAGAKAFILNYRAGGRERRITIGSFPDWMTVAARDHAKVLKQRIDLGEDPMQARHDERKAPTVADLCDRFEAEHLPKRRGATERDYRSILRLYVRPQLGRIKVADLRHSDVERLHHAITTGGAGGKPAPYRANRTVAVLSKMLGLAVKWEWRGDNPARGIERAPEEKRERFLTPAEIGRLAEALIAHPEKTSANALRLMLLTGARKGETLAAKWSEFDLEAGVWTKPSAHTKGKREHRVPLSAPAMALLTEMRAASRGVHVFAGGEGKPLTEIKRTWAAVCERAGISSVRMHDLRHTYAAVLASSGLSLPIIGALLGHTQAATTHRYAHLLDDPLRAATERVGALVSGKAAAEVVPMARKA